MKMGTDKKKTQRRRKQPEQRQERQIGAWQPIFGCLSPFGKTSAHCPDISSSQVLVGEGVKL